MSAAPGNLTARYQQALALAQSGKRGDALTELQALATLKPGVPEILFQIGRIEALEGRKPEAEAALRQALKLRPREPAIWQALHAVLQGADRSRLEREAGKAKVFLGSRADLKPVMALLSQGMVEQAEAKALAAVKSAPEAFWPAFSLGQARAAQGHFAAALGPLEKAVERDPDPMDARAALADCLVELGQFYRAEILLGTGEGAGLLPLAKLYRMTARPEEAVDVLRSAKPVNAAMLRELSLALAETGATESAIETASKATKPGPRRVHLLRQISRALQEAGADEGAEQALDAALAETPGDPALRVLRAQMWQSGGHLVRAEEDLRAVIQAHPDMAEAYRAYANGRKVVRNDPVLDQLQAQLDRLDLPKEMRRVFHFAAAKAAGDLGEHARAFGHLETANRLTAEAFPYGFDADLEEARQLVRDWQDNLHGWQSTGPDDPALFVTGLPRSGTTLIETILSAHPDVTAGGEMPFFGRAAMPAIQAMRARQGGADRFAEAGQLYLRAARRRTGAGKVMTDKAISTFSRIGHAAMALPAARFLILRRDHRDVGLSMFRNMFPDGLHRYTSDLIGMGRYMRLHDALVSFWAEALPDRVHIVDYEALTADPEPNIRALVEFTGLPWDDACLAPERSDRRVQTLSFAQVRAPIGRQAVAGWTRYEAQLQPLIRALDDTQIDLFATP